MTCREIILVKLSLTLNIIGSVFEIKILANCTHLHVCSLLILRRKFVIFTQAIGNALAAISLISKSAIFMILCHNIFLSCFTSLCARACSSWFHERSPFSSNLQPAWKPEMKVSDSSSTQWLLQSTSWLSRNFCWHQEVENG